MSAWYLENHFIEATSARTLILEFPMQIGRDQQSTLPVQASQVSRHHAVRRWLLVRAPQSLPISADHGPCIPSRSRRMDFDRGHDLVRNGLVRRT